MPLEYACCLKYPLLDFYAEHLVTILLDCTFHCFPCCSTTAVVGWSDITSAVKNDANFWHRVWEEAGCPSAGVLFNIKRAAKRRFKYEVRCLKRKRQVMLRNKLAHSFARKKKDKFWSDVKRLNRSGYSSLPPTVDGTMVAAGILLMCLLLSLNVC